MIRRLAPVMIALAALPIAWNVDRDATCQAQVTYRQRTAPDLFYNYYVPAGSQGGVPAQLYLSPRPTPRLVGHTYVTYQPLMPHEFLYPHRRKYWRKNPDGGWTSTSVCWYHKCLCLDCLCRVPAPIVPLGNCCTDSFLSSF